MSFEAKLVETKICGAAVAVAAAVVVVVVVAVAAVVVVVVAVVAVKRSQKCRSWARNAKV